MNTRLTEDYRVRLDAFEGPLDLLLYLIRKHEVEITDIPVARIAREYMAFLTGLERVDIEDAGEFLVMAATLMEIKSRMLTPSAARAESEGGVEAREAEGDPRADLVRQLLEFKKYRDAAMSLEQRLDEWQRRFPVAAARAAQVQPPPEAEEAGAVDADDLHLSDLIEAFRSIMETVQLDRVGDHRVTFDDTPVELHAEDVVDWLGRVCAAPAEGESPAREIDGRPAVEFARMFQGRTRPEMIGLFLALLQLVKNRRVLVRQEGVAGVILIAPAPEDASADAAALGGESPSPE